MKRLLAITVLCTLLVAAAGTTAVVASKPDTAQAGKSPIYQFGVQPSGKVIINTKTHTFVYTGTGFVPGQRYYLQYHVTGRTGALVVGTGVANPAGHVIIRGTLTDEQLSTILNNLGTFSNLPFVL